MTQKYKLYGLIILLVIILACSFGGGVAPDPTPPPPKGDGPTQPDRLETATVATVTDGDTIELADGRRVRYIGINTPERDQPYYQEATDINRQLVGNQEVQLEFDVETFDKYGRTLAYVWVEGVMINLEIIRQGYANAFTVPPNVRYEEQFREAERKARQAERGLWAGSPAALKILHIEADAPGNDSENPNGEWIEIVNQGSEPVQMQGYTLKDEANHIYTFEAFTVRPGASFRLYTGQGSDSTTELFWGFSGESVWNNGSDAAFLRDADGALVDTLAY